VTTTIANHPLFILFTAIFETLTLLKHSTQPKSLSSLYITKPVQPTLEPFLNRPTPESHHQVIVQHQTDLNHITNDSSKNLTHKKNLFEMEVEKGLKPLVLGKV
jgi:hypothetical protein